MENNLLYQFDLEKGKEIIGVDEAGRGPLAGSVVAAAVKLKRYSEELQEINDSKKLTEKKKRKAFWYNYGKLWSRDRYSFCTRDRWIKYIKCYILAMRRAIEELDKKTNTDVLVLVDGNFKIREYIGKQEPIIKRWCKKVYQ